MFVVLAEEWIIPGKRPEMVQAHEAALAALKEEPGFVSGRLLHFAGGPYRYLFEMTWRSRGDWERFWNSGEFAGFRAGLDKNHSQPFLIQLYDVKADTSA